MKEQLRKRARGLIITAAAIGLALTASAAHNSADAKPRPIGGKKSAAAAKASPKPLSGVLNINTATAMQLSMLPGIGDAKARRIVAYRARRGPFRRVRDLRRVSGIGRKTVARLARHLAVKGKNTLRAGPSR